MESAQLLQATASLRASPVNLVPMVCVELPDMPWGHAYRRFVESRMAQHSEDFLPVVISSNADYREGGEAGSLAARECLRALFQTGKPPAHFVRVFSLRTASVPTSASA